MASLVGLCKTSMPWTERYFETQYLAEVIVCVLVLAAVAIAGVIWIFKKVTDFISRKVYEKQLEKSKTTSDKWKDELEKW